jgi:hypothetical protein
MSTTQAREFDLTLSTSTSSMFATSPNSALRHLNQSQFTAPVDNYPQGAATSGKPSKAKFLVSGFALSNIAVNNEMVYTLRQTGATVAGSGTERFKDELSGVPLGPDGIVTTDDLSIKHQGAFTPTSSAKDFAKICNQTEYGCLILAGPLQNWCKWRRSECCTNEVKHVAEGRLFVYLLVDGVGYIVGASMTGNASSATMQEGKGALIWNNGGYYKGQLKNGVPSGYGVACYADGSRYEGAWENGLHHGKWGRFQYTDGKKYEGRFSSGAPHYHHSHCCPFLTILISPLQENTTGWGHFCIRMAVDMKATELLGRNMGWERSTTQAGISMRVCLRTERCMAKAPSTTLTAVDTTAISRRGAIMARALSTTRTGASTKGVIRRVCDTVLAYM